MDIGSSMRFGSVFADMPKTVRFPAPPPCSEPTSWAPPFAWSSPFLHCAKPPCRNGRFPHPPYFASLPGSTRGPKPKLGVGRIGWVVSARCRGWPLRIRGRQSRRASRAAAGVAQRTDENRRPPPTPARTRTPPSLRRRRRERAHEVHARTSRRTRRPPDAAGASAPATSARQSRATPRKAACRGGERVPVDDPGAPGETSHRGASIGKM